MAKKKKEKETPAPITDIMASIDAVSDKMGLPPANLLTGGFMQGSISTGSWALDLIIGGGWPRNKWATVTGWEGSGKSTLLYEAGASAQALDIPILIFDHEGAFDASYCKTVGFDLEHKKTRIFQPDTGEFTFRFINRLCQTLPNIPQTQIFPTCIIMIDSLAAMIPEAQKDDDEQNALSLQARMFSTYMRLIKGQMASKGLTVIATNQLREKPMVMYGSPEYESGGNAIKFFPDLKLRTRRKGGKSGIWIEDNYPTMMSTLTTLKNKGFPPFQDGELYIHMGGGVAPVRDRLYFLTMTGMLQKNFNCVTGKTTKGTDSFMIPGWKDHKTIVRGDTKRLAACHDEELDKYIKEALEAGSAFQMYRQMKGIFGMAAAANGMLLDNSPGVLDALPEEAGLVKTMDGDIVDPTTGEVLVTDQMPEIDEDPEHLASIGSQEPMEKAEQAVEEVVNAS